MLLPKHLLGSRMQQQGMQRFGVQACLCVFRCPSLCHRLPLLCSAAPCNCAADCRQIALRLVARFSGGKGLAVPG